MSKPKSNYYVTTPIYYVTAKPHVGTLYSTIIADVAARWEKIQGKNIFFLTGTDEHGQKIEQAALKAGKDPKTFVDSFISSYKDMWKAYELDYTHFIRTTDEYHVKAVQEIISRLIKQGDIYKSHYKGWYCTPDETFVAEASDNDTQAPPCPQCNRQTIAMSEESYFFKLSAYQDRLLKFYEEHPAWTSPKERIAEVKSFVSSGLKDLSISRTSVTWGIPFPGDPKHVVYVWIDALANYLTGVGYLSHARDTEFDQWWPVDLQILGKDIVRFHAVYWPAILMALNLPISKRLLVHGWITVDDKKMSKSFGNAIDPEILLKAYGPEPVRYYLMRQIPVNQDGNFSFSDLEHRVGADLADSLGNLLNRMVSLAHQHNVTELTAQKKWSPKSAELHEQAQKCIEQYCILMDASLYHQALGVLWTFIGHVNGYFHAQEPWRIVKTDKEAFIEILSATAHSLRIIALLLWPVLPKKMEELLFALGFKILNNENMIKDLVSEKWDHEFVLRKIDVLFIKPEAGVYESIMKEKMSEKEEKKDETSAISTISIEDLSKIYLAVGTITDCQIVEKSDKLYKLTVDLGVLGNRTILAGVRNSFDAHDLIGKQGVFVTNLAPRKLMGVESQGMMLIAQDESGKLQLVSPGSAVPNGTRLR